MLPATHSLPRRAADPKRNHQAACPRQPGSPSLLPFLPKMLPPIVGPSSPRSKICPQERVRPFTQRDQRLTGEEKKSAFFQGFKVRHQRNGPLKVGFQVSTSPQGVTVQGPGASHSCTGFGGPRPGPPAVSKKEANQEGESVSAASGRGAGELQALCI